MSVSKGLLALFGVAAVGGVALLAMSGGGHSSDGLDANLPDDVRRAVAKALAVETDQGKLLTFANVLDPEGYPLAAAALRSKAAHLAALSGTSPAAPQIPSAPPSFPPAPNQPPVVVPPSPPAIVVPSTPTDPEIIPPFVPPVVLPPDVPVAPPDAFNPGPLPRLPALPPSAGQFSTAHADFQQALAEFYSAHNVAGPSNSAGPGALVVYTSDDADGVIGPRTQIATWIFQRWSNIHAGTVLTEDGIPGPSTLTALNAANEAAGVA